MIRFSLSCRDGHRFEPWFRSGAAFDAEAAAGRIECPVCGSTAVEKALMAPAVASGRAEPAAAAAQSVPAPAETGSPATEPLRLASADPETAKLMQMMREIGRKVRENSDYVGDRFADEARKIHFNEVPKRSIHGEATPDEARALAEEGIAFHPLPLLPEERN